MERKEVGTSIAFQNDESVIYLITPISDCAGVLGVTGVPVADPKADLEEMFQEDGLTKLVLFVEEHNTDFVKLARSLGFKQEGRLKKACSTGDYLVFGQYR
jgi:hypothetical protein